MFFFSKNGIIGFKVIPEKRKTRHKIYLNYSKKRPSFKKQPKSEVFSSGPSVIKDQTEASKICSEVMQNNAFRCNAFCFLIIILQFTDPL